MEEWDSRPGILQKDRQRKIMKNLLKIQLAKKAVIRVEIKLRQCRFKLVQIKTPGLGLGHKWGQNFTYIEKYREKTCNLHLILIYCTILPKYFEFNSDLIRVEAFVFQVSNQAFGPLVFKICQILKLYVYLSDVFLFVKASLIQFESKINLMNYIQCLVYLFSKYGLSSPIPI